MLNFCRLLLILATAITAMPASALQTGKPTVLITGSNRGIGLEFVRQFDVRGWNVIATARKPSEAEALQALAADNERMVIEQLDVTDHARIDELAEKYRDWPIDILLSNAALTPRYRSAFRPVSGVDFETARASFEINALAPLKLCQAFIDHVAASDQKKIIAMSSKGGSFGLSPKMPMMYGYRASKAALNMFMYTLSFEAKKKGVIVTMVSPGLVNTTPGMENPNALSPEESVTMLLEVIDGLTPENNGQFLDYSDGSILAW